MGNLAKLKAVNEFCSCGAQLPPDARFCHKCGQPQFEVTETETASATEVPPPPPVVPAAQVAIEAPGLVSLKNPVAVRTAFLVGAACSILIFVPMPPLFQSLWQMVLLVAGGFIAVYVFVRRTHVETSTRAGAALGWITGLFCFLILLVLFTLLMVAMASMEGGLQGGFRELIAQRGNADFAKQVNELLDSPEGIATFLFSMLMTMFFMLTLLPTLGGMLAAKVLGKD